MFLLLLEGNEMNSDLIAGADKAAAFMGLSRRKVYRLAELGHLPVIRKGRRLYFRKSELEHAFRAWAPSYPIGFGRTSEWEGYPGERGAQRLEKFQ